MKKHFVRLTLAALACCLFSPKTFAQFEFGGHARGQDWQILSSPAVRVIYPKGMEDRAQRIAGIINYMNENNRRSIGQQRRRIDMVLQNRTLVPNGYVALAPFRSEFFSTPPQSNLFLGSADWLDMLSIHEYRHAQQILNSKRGVSRVAYWLQGEGIWSLLGNVSVPNWYSEGDAVITETALSASGRGRAPFFTMQQRALALADKNYSYLKHRNGSYKSLLPDHYRLGYLILNKTRKDFGNDITQKIHRDASSYRGIIWPYARATKRHTGLYPPKLYRAAWEEKKTEWAEALKTTELRPTVPVTQKPKHTVTNYRSPRVMADGSIMAQLYSYKKTPQLVRITPDGKERKICTIGISFDDYISLGGGKIAWTEDSRDGRRGYRSYSNIWVWDEKEGRRRLTNRTRLFSPAFSPDGQRLAAIHISQNQENRVVFLDPKTGTEGTKLPNPQNYFLSRLAWTADGRSLVSVAKHQGQLAVVKIDAVSGAMTELTPWSANTLDAPTVAGDRVFFNAGFSGIDNIFSTDLSGSKQVFQITSVPVGAFDPSVSADGKTLVFAEFTEMGHVISKMDLTESKMNLPERAAQRSRQTPVQITEPSAMAQYETMATRSEGGDILGKFPATNYTSKSYAGFFRGLKLHSWGFTPSVSTPSLSVEMTNMLSDLAISAQGSLNRNEGNGKAYNFEFQSGRFYPGLALTAGLADRTADFYSPADSLVTQKFSENRVGGLVVIPLAWMKGNYFTSFRPSIGYNRRNQTGIEVEGKRLSDQNFGAFEIKTHLSSVRRNAPQNVGIRGGFALDASLERSLGASNNVDKFFARGSVFLPGLAANHAFEIKLAYQNEPLSATYQLADAFEYPRGYGLPIINDRFSQLTLNYGLPLFYPDWGFGGILYFKRVRANLFYDAGTAFKTRFDTKTNYRSAGVELILDHVMLNLLSTSFGLRNSFLLEKDPLNANRKTRFEFFTSVGF